MRDGRELLQWHLHEAHNAPGESKTTLRGMWNLYEHDDHDDFHDDHDHMPSPDYMYPSPYFAMHMQRWKRMRLQRMRCRQRPRLRDGDIFVRLRRHLRNHTVHGMRYGVPV